MGPAIRITAWVAVFVAIGATAAAWFSVRGELDADDAGEIAAAALASVDVEATVARVPERGVHEPAGEAPVEVWVVVLDADGDEIETRIQTDAGVVVYIDDRIGENDTERLLTDDEFTRLGDFRDRRLRDARVRQNLAATAAAAAAAAVGFTLASRTPALLHPSKDQP